LLNRLQRVLKHRISYNKSVEEISLKYLVRINSVKFFAKEMLEERIENNIRKDILYKNYKEFGYKNKIPHKSEYAFSQVMCKNGFSYGQLRNGKDRQYYWINIKIKDKSFCS